MSNILFYIKILGIMTEHYFNSLRRSDRKLYELFVEGDETCIYGIAI